MYSTSEQEKEFLNKSKPLTKDSITDLSDRELNSLFNEY